MVLLGFYVFIDICLLTASLFTFEFLKSVFCFVYFNKERSLKCNILYKLRLRFPIHSPYLMKQVKEIHLKMSYLFVFYFESPLLGKAQFYSCY